MSASRPAAAALALLAGAGLLLQLVLSMRLGIANRHGALSGAWQFLGYFTVLSNGLVAWIALRGALMADGGRDLRWRGCAVTAIVLVGVGYHLLLRQVWNPQGAQWLADVLLHYAVPAAALSWWLALPPRHPLAAIAPVQWLLWPAAYAVYALARGAATGFYPYPFIDVPSLGMPRVLLNAAALMLGFVLTGYLLRAGAHWRARAA
ncbi:MAG: Pr6Pr family membrane protein [Thermomonas sp.]